jgi:hypothetical protein
MILTRLCYAGYKRMADFKNAIHKLIGLHVGPTSQAAVLAMVLVAAGVLLSCCSPHLDAENASCACNPAAVESTPILLIHVYCVSISTSTGKYHTTQHIDTATAGWQMAGAATVTNLVPFLQTRSCCLCSSKWPGALQCSRWEVGPLLWLLGGVGATFLAGGQTGCDCKHTSSMQYGSTKLMPRQLCWCLHACATAAYCCKYGGVAHLPSSALCLLVPVVLLEPAQLKCGLLCCR